MPRIFERDDQRIAARRFMPSRPLLAAIAYILISVTQGRRRAYFAVSARRQARQIAARAIS